MNTIKVIAFFIGFAALFAGMFWLGAFAPIAREEGDATEEGSDRKKSKKTK